MGITSLETGFRVGRYLIIPYHIVLVLVLLWSRWKAVRNVFLALLGIPMMLVFRDAGRSGPIGCIDHTPKTQVARAGAAPERPNGSPLHQDRRVPPPRPVVISVPASCARQFT
jgi:hypothetical protein